MSMADASFQARLDRINSGKVFVAEGLLGNGELNKIRQRQAKGKGPASQPTVGVVEQEKFPVKKAIVSTFLGMIAFFGGSLGAFHASQGVATDFDKLSKLAEGLGPMGLSVILALILLYASGYRSVLLVGFIVAGFYATHFAEPHMARAAPTVWTVLYSADHADGLKFQAIAQMVEWGLAPPAELTPAVEPAAE